MLGNLPHVLVGAKLEETVGRAKAITKKSILQSKRQ